MSQIVEAIRPAGSPGPGSGSGSGPETSNPTCSLFVQAGSLFQGTAGSDPFGDAHMISRITDVSVDDLNRVEVSTYQEDDTNGRLYYFNTNNHAEYRLEGAVVLELVARNESVQHVVATFPTEAFSGDRTDGEGEISIVSQLLLASADFAISLATDSFRFVLL
jgi:hypothetical protein